MKYYIFVKDGKIDGAGQCRQITDGVVNVEVTKDVYDIYCETPNKYTYSDGAIVENPNYEAEEEAKRKATQIAELQKQLDTLDLKAIRALRAIQAGTCTEADSTKLAELEAQAAEIRQQLKLIDEESK